jgi:uncharacterized protein (TIGR02996 family)
MTRRASPAPDALSAHRSAWRGRLLDAVIAEPDDDGPRSVYADWLIARGDPPLAARGELIVVQCALEQLNDPEEHNWLKARDFELVERHGIYGARSSGREARNNHPSECEVELRRGFVEKVMMPVGDYPRVAAWLRQRAARTPSLTGWAPEVVERLPTSVPRACRRAAAARGAPVAALRPRSTSRTSVLELIGNSTSTTWSATARSRDLARTGAR